MPGLARLLQVFPASLSRDDPEAPTRGAPMTARDIMTANPIVVSGQVTVAEAAEIIRESDIRHLPVVDDGILVGMLSDRDLRSTVFGVEGFDSPRAWFSTPVCRLMSPDVICVGPETELGEVIAAMIQTKVGAIPVIDPLTREVLGIVSYIDVLEAAQDLVEEA